MSYNLCRDIYCVNVVATPRVFGRIEGAELRRPGAPTDHRPGGSGARDLASTGCIRWTSKRGGSVTEG